MNKVHFAKKRRTVLLLTLKGDRRNLCGEGKLMMQGREGGGSLEQIANAAMTAFVSSTLPSPFAPKSMTFKVVDAQDVLNSNDWSANNNARKIISLTALSSAGSRLSLLFKTVQGRRKGVRIFMALAGSVSPSNVTSGPV